MTIEIPEGTGVRIANWLRSLVYRFNAQFQKEEVNWRDIEETRQRLTRMRFRRDNEAQAASASYMTDVHRENTELGDTALGGIRQSQKDSMVRWFVTGKNGLEAHLTQVVYKDQANSRYFSDSDVTLKKRRDQYGNTDYVSPDYFGERASEESAAPPPQDANYEPLFLPGVNYDINASAGAIRGFIEQTDFPALEEPQSDSYLGSNDSYFNAAMNAGAGEFQSAQFEPSPYEPEQSAQFYASPESAEEAPAAPVEEEPKKFDFFRQFPQAAQMGTQQNQPPSPWNGSQ